MPRRTASAKPRKCRLQWTSSDHGLQIPTTGRPSAAAAGSEARWTKPARSRPPNQRALRKPRESGIVRIYVTGPVPSAVADVLAADFEVSDTPEGADGILSLLTTPVDVELLDRAGAQLQIVANYAVGVNNIDLEAAGGRGVLVANTPDVLTRPTAELAVTLMLTLLRRVAEGDRLIRRREPWGFSLEFMLGESLDGKLVGIVGPGRIGRETARLLEAVSARTAIAGQGAKLGRVLRGADDARLDCPLAPPTPPPRHAAT